MVSFAWLAWREVVMLLIILYVYLFCPGEIYVGRHTSGSSINVVWWSVLGTPGIGWVGDAIPEGDVNPAGSAPPPLLFFYCFVLF